MSIPHFGMSAARGAVDIPASATFDGLLRFHCLDWLVSFCPQLPIPSSTVGTFIYSDQYLSFIF